MNAASESSPRRTGATAPSVMVRALLFAVGFSPIGVLALSLLDVTALDIAGPPAIAAAVATTIGLMIGFPSCRTVVARGLAGGLIAVLVYDVTRLPFVVFGGWPDFIPKIGVWLLDDGDAHWSIGYLWRYLGNGAGMGLAFGAIEPVVDRLVGRQRGGVLYGVAIWSGLLLTVTIAPDGQSKLFPLTLATLLLSLIGHLVYGGVLGKLAATHPSGSRFRPAAPVIEARATGHRSDGCSPRYTIDNAPSPKRS